MNVRDDFADASCSHNKIEWMIKKSLHCSFKKRKIRWDPVLHIRILKSFNQCINYHIRSGGKIRKFMKAVDGVNYGNCRVRRKKHVSSAFPEEVAEVRNLPKKEDGSLDLVNEADKKLEKCFRRLLGKQENIFQKKYTKEFQEKIEEYLNQYRSELTRRVQEGEFEIEELD